MFKTVITPLLKGAGFSLLLCAGLHAKTTPIQSRIERSLWSCDRYDMGDLSETKLSELKQKNQAAQGWAEYDFTIPEAGWYELFFQGATAGWERDLFVDGSPLLRMRTSSSEDMVKGQRGLYKECNIYFDKGRHTLKLRRLNFPGNLPQKWILERSTTPNGCLFARIEGNDILRAGEKLTLLVTGGFPDKATSYDIIAHNVLDGSNRKVASVDFPASNVSINRKIEISCDQEGVFQLRAEYENQKLPPNDLRAGDFIVIDTNKKPVAAQVKKQLIHDIDCVAQTDTGKAIKLNENFWEAFGETRVNSCEGGKYREGGDNLDPDIPIAPKGHNQKYKSGFSYAIDVPATQTPYLLEVEYPDDDRRTTNVIILEDAKKSNGLQYPAAQLGSGYETGDWFELTNKLQLHQVVFWPTTKKLRVALVSMNPGMRPAAARIRVYKLDGGLPGQVKAKQNGRILACWTEEPGRWYAYFRPFDKPYGSMVADFIAIKRYTEICRYAGINAINSTEACYQPTTYRTDELEGWFQRAHDAPRILALMCEKYDLRYIPELHLSGQKWFNSRVMRKLIANPEQLYIYSRLGTSSEKQGSWFAPRWNCLHPAIQQKYIDIIGELVDKISDTSAFAGVSSRLMTWVWESWNSLPSLNWGYGDWTVAQFEKDTGVTVPGSPNDPNRFEKRFQFLTSSPTLKKWLAWRQQKVMSYLRRIRDRIQKNSPNAMLYLPYYGDEKQAMDLIFGSLTQTPRGALEEAGIDFATLLDEPGISLCPSSSFGRRDSTPLSDQEKTDKLLDPEHKALGKNHERGFVYGNDYFEVHTRVPIHKLGLPNLTPGAYCGAAEAAGRAILEKFSLVLADQDTNFMRIGGLGYTFGQPKFYHEWLSEYENLPQEPFTPFEQAIDPVALWYRDHEDGFYMYAVNREPYQIQLEIKMKNVREVKQLGTKKKWKLDGEVLSITLAPFQLIAFKTDKGAKITTAKSIVPKSRIELVKRRLTFCQQLANSITEGKRKNDVSEKDKKAFLKQLDIAWEAFKKGHYWRARTVLRTTPMLKVFEALAQFPPHLLKRKSSVTLLKTESSNRYSPVKASMLTAVDIRKRMPDTTQVDLIESESFDPDWRFTKVLKTKDGTLTANLKIPYAGKYQLSIGHITDNYGAATVTTGSIAMPLLMETKELTIPDKTVFPVTVFKQGDLQVRIQRQNGFGIYGLTLQPIYAGIPSPYWMTIGPFDGVTEDFRVEGAVKRGLEKVEPPEREIDFDTEYVGADGQKVKWQYSDKLEGDGIPHFTKSAGIPFLFRCKVQQQRVCYALTYIYCPDERDAELLIGCEWWANAFLNNEKIVSERSSSDVAKDGAAFNTWTPTPAKIRLKKGVNTLLVKSQGGTVANFFTCYISDPGDLKFAHRREDL